MKLSRVIGWSLLLSLLFVSSAFAATRFIDNGDQTVTDTKTGLVWTKDANLPRAGWGYGWQQSLDYVAAMNRANGGAGTFGHNDWRLPEIKELESLVDPTRQMPALPLGHPFINVALDEYWSSTVNPNKYAYVFGVDMAGGYTYSGHDYNFGFVWPVRGQMISSGYLSISPGDYDFGSLPPNTPSTQTFTLSNLGTANLTVSGIATTGGSSSLFTVAPGSCGTLTPTIAAGGSCTIAVTFGATSVGTSSTTLRISSNDPSAAFRDVQLRGTGADVSAPVVTTFTIPATSQTLTVPVTSLTATDNVGVTGYCISESDNADACSWTAAAPSQYTFPSVTPAGKTLYAWAKDAAGNRSAARTAGVTIDTSDHTPPALQLSTLSDGSQTSEAILNIAGRATDATAVASLTIAGTPVARNADGSFSHLVVLAPGTTTITTVATDAAGNQTADSRSITLDPALPALQVTTPADNSTARGNSITLTGTIVPPVAGVAVTVNGGTPQSAAIDGSSFSTTVNLAAGLNTVEVKVTDLSGKSNTMKRSVISDAQRPTVNINTPSGDIKTSTANQTIAGTITDAVTPVNVTVSDGSATYSAQVGNGTFSQAVTLSEARKYPFVVTVTEGNGNKTMLQRNILFAPTRFSLNGDQTVTDNLTGLNWTRNADLPGLSVSWQEALDYVAAMNSANGGAGTFGHNDWRLPTVDELYTLVDTSMSLPSLPAGHPFTGVAPDEYWSSSVVPNKYAYVFGVSFDYGFKYSGHDYNFGFVWPVRGAQSLTTALQGTVTGSTYSQTLTAGSGTAPYTWSVTSGVLPTGITLDPATGTLSGTASKSGVYSFTVRAIDAGGATITKQVAITVNDAVCSNAAVVIDGGSGSYADIPDAYVHAADNALIKLQSLDFTSDLLFNRDLRVSLLGGYDCGYTASSQSAGILGTMRITSGTVKIANLRLR